MTSPKDLKTVNKYWNLMYSIDYCIIHYENLICHRMKHAKSKKASSRRIWGWSCTKQTFASSTFVDGKICMMY